MGLAWRCLALKSDVGVLEKAGLVVAENVGRVRTCRLGGRGLAEKDGRTQLELSEPYPTKEAVDRSFEGMEEGMPEQFEQLDALLAAS